MKNYIGFSLDYSASMRSIARAAAQDFNETVKSIREAAIEFNQNTMASVMKCGYQGRGSHNTKNVFAQENVNILAVNPIDTYDANGNCTPLFDSVNELIKSFQKLPDANDPEVSFLINVITDGHDNASYITARELGKIIENLQNTDRWTFVFRVPVGYKRSLVSMGIPDGNILEWETTSQGMQKATTVTTQSARSFYDARSKGATSSSTFFVNVGNVDKQVIKANMVDISSEVSIWSVMPNEDGTQIRDFCEKRLTTGMLKGAAFYELTKTEKKVQDYKQIIIRDKTTKEIFGGSSARDILGLPHNGDVKLAPGDFGKYTVFIQSTSVNRKVPSGSEVLYWPKVGIPFVNK